MAENETEISTLGEFGLIDRLTEGMSAVNESTVYGVGDDAAVLNYPSDRDILVTTDMLLENVHFDLTYVPLKHLGYKSAIVNFSDICAMNGTPRQITVSLGISKRFTVEHIEALYAGMRIACEEYGVDIIGGDTCASNQGLVISITCIGDCAEGRAVRRADFVPDFAGKEYLIERQLKPEARKDIVRELAEANVVPTAMIDISDGLSSELMHICKQSNCGCRVYEDRIPIDYQTAVMAEELNMNLVTAALNGGEDYELLFTVPLTDHDKVKDMKGVHVIGYITKAADGCAMITRDGGEFPLKAQGWNPLAKSEEE